jgi:hypothetical protein
MFRSPPGETAVAGGGFWTPQQTPARSPGLPGGEPALGKTHHGSIAKEAAYHFLAGDRSRTPTREKSTQQGFSEAPFGFCDDGPGHYNWT